MGLLAEVEEARRALREVAVRDGLTNLNNRRFFAARLSAEIARARREEASLTLIPIGVDHFKRINDAWGHATGDEVLCRVADTLMAHVRPYDLSARFGGEEFVTLLPGTTLAEGAEVADRIRVGIQALCIPALMACSSCASARDCARASQVVVASRAPGQGCEGPGSPGRWVVPPQPSGVALSA